MGMMDRIYDRPEAKDVNTKLGAMTGIGQCETAATMPYAEKEIRRASIAEQVVDRVKTARRNVENSYRLERFAELGDRHPEVLEMLEIARDFNLL